MPPKGTWPGVWGGSEQSEHIAPAILLSLREGLSQGGAALPL